MRPFFAATLGFWILSTIFGATAHAAVFAPSSCDDLHSRTLDVEANHEIDYRIDGVTAATSTKSIFITRGTDTDPWTRNASVWTNEGLTPLDLSGASPWNSENGYTKGGTLVTPRHVVFADHYPIATGSVLAFIAPDNTIVTRTLVDEQNVAGDIRVGVLDSDVPASIAFYPVLTDEDVAEYLHTEDPAFLLLDREEKALVWERTVAFAPYAWSHMAPSATSSRYAFYEELVVGDSGKPGFLIVNNQPILTMINYSQDTASLVGYFIDEIDDAIVALGNDGGYRLSHYDFSCFTNTNQAPTFSANTYAYNLSEGAPTGATVGTPNATDPDAGDTISYEIVSSTATTTFSIDESTGELTLLDEDLLDYDATSTYELVLRATDDDPTNPLSDSATVTITITTDDRPDVSFDESTSSVNEDAGTANANIVLSRAYTKDVSVRVTSSDDTAKSGSDYDPIDTILVISAGSTEMPVTLHVHQDSSAQSDKKFVLALSAPTKASLGAQTSHRVTITNTNARGSGGGGGGGGGGSGKSTAISPAGQGSPREALIAALVSLIKQFIALGGETTPAMRAFVSQTRFTRDLEIGSVGEDVRELQRFLNTHGFPIAVSGLGSKGNETTYFGTSTRDALRRFQESQGIMPASGYFGPITRSVAESLQ